MISKFAKHQKQTKKGEKRRNVCGFVFQQNELCGGCGSKTEDVR